jgi:hypothetical protein
MGRKSTFAVPPKLAFLPSLPAEAVPITAGKPWNPTCAESRFQTHALRWLSFFIGYRPSTLTGSLEILVRITSPLHRQDDID